MPLSDVFAECPVPAYYSILWSIYCFALSGHVLYTCSDVFLFWNFFQNVPKCVTLLLSGPAEEEGRLWQSNRWTYSLSFPAVTLSQVPLPSQGGTCAAPTWWQRKWVSGHKLQRAYFLWKQELVRALFSCLFLHLLSTFTSSLCSEEDSPQWLKELKSKKRLSQYESES